MTDFLIAIGVNVCVPHMWCGVVGCFGVVDNLGDGGGRLSCRTEGGEQRLYQELVLGFLYSFLISLVHIESCCGVLKALEDRSFLIV